MSNDDIPLASIIVMLLIGLVAIIAMAIMHYLHPSMGLFFPFF